MKTKNIILSIAVFALLAQSAIGEADLTKVVVIALEFMEGNLQQNDITIAYNYPPDYKVPPTQGLRIEIRSADGELLDGFFRPDPREVFISGFGYVYEENASFDLILGFIDGMRTVEISDDEGSLVSVDLTGAIGEFCSEENDICDPECAGFADPDCITTTLPTTVPTTTLEPEERQDLGSYLPYLIGAIALVLIAIVVLKGNRRRRMQHKGKEEEQKLRIWTEQQLRNGEDPELLKKALKEQNSDPSMVDEFMKKLQ